MFKFRLIDMPNGLQIIDENLMTPYDSITPEQMIDYIRVEQAMEVIKIHKRNREIHNMERNKLKTILFRIACMLLNWAEIVPNGDYLYKIVTCTLMMAN